jgi:hypothetical protein
VWPRRKHHPLVRVGRLNVELWQPGADGLRCVSQRPLGLTRRPDVQLMSECLATLLENRSSEGRGLDLVVESAWMPVMHLPMAPTLWSMEQATNLLRHRLGLLQGIQPEHMSSWQLAVDYLPGNACGLGYGLSPAVREALHQAVHAANCKVHSMQPALAWGGRRLPDRPARRRSNLKGTQARIWVEQDRALVVLDQVGKVLHLNACAEAPSNDEQALLQFQIECARAGLSPVAAPGAPAVIVGRWRGEAPGASRTQRSDVQWCELSHTSDSADSTDMAPADGTAGALPGAAL